MATLVSADATTMPRSQAARTVSVFRSRRMPRAHRSRIKALFVQPALKDHGGGGGVARAPTALVIPGP